MLRACRALKLALFFFMASDSPALGFPAVFAPCSPKRITFSLPPSQALTTWDFLGWLGVRLGWLHFILLLSTRLDILTTPDHVRDFKGPGAYLLGPATVEKLYCSF